MKGTILSKKLLQTFDKFLVIRRSLNVFGKVLSVLDEVDASTFANHEEDVILGLTRCFADYAQDARSQLPLLFIRPSVPHIARNKGHLFLLNDCIVTEFPDV
jgi:hypothetical protein